ncbi:putative alkyl hydroperoxide reductase [Spiroplasma kunkelii CR2-3x]|uniref:thioredoxin-dependent peroxiredoxin n=1 Tax=Spiroplasma kunkelii CR2-3x TaxID=273035 RepID=A0A0K2JFX0_SPIKU|nr:peroxiredoxin [Spiroplasma kunkelii]ALA97489.1 putative alkyl hydroperoxide reductase [Spiroplasma kunkelii CR2-3x]
MNLKQEKFLFTDGKEHLITDFQKEKGYIFYFFPKAATPGCTLETVAYNRYYQKFLTAGYNVIGISRDNLKKQTKFQNDNNVSFPMLCDIDSKLCEMFGVLKKKKIFNNVYLGIERSTFLLDNDFKIIQEWPKVKPVEHIKTVLSVVTETDLNNKS